ncbi:MAG: enoyl-CoA hydratase/isomerase family protein [Flavobacteriales bacterium]
MQDGYVRTNSERGIATVTFHHPKSNSLPGHVLRGMAQAITEAGRDASVRVIVLRSEGDKAFCAGASFDELLAIDSVEKGTTFFSGFAIVINAIRTSPCFVIGRIHSKAVGGGVGLAAACDASYAHESSAARLSELAIGIGPFVVGPAVERKIGTSAFGLMTFTPAVWRDAQWCREKGLYGSVSGSVEELDAAVNAHARELAGYSPDAMRELKVILWAGTEHWDKLLAERAAMSGRLVLSEHTVQAIGKFKAGK